MSAHLGGKTNFFENIIFFENLSRGNRALFDFHENHQHFFAKKHRKKAEKNMFYTSISSIFMRLIWNRHMTWTWSWCHRIWNKKLRQQVFAHLRHTKSTDLNLSHKSNFVCVPFVCKYCGSNFISRELWYSSMTYFNFAGIVQTVIKLWQFEVHSSYRGTVWRLPLRRYCSQNSSLSLKK